MGDVKRRGGVSRSIPRENGIRVGEVYQRRPKSDVDLFLFPSFINRPRSWYTRLDPLRPGLGHPNNTRFEIYGRLLRLRETSHFFEEIWSVRPSTRYFETEDPSTIEG